MGNLRSDSRITHFTFRSTCKKIEPRIFANEHESKIRIRVFRIDSRLICFDQRFICEDLGRNFLPAHSFPQARNVRQMMVAVPAVELQQPIHIVRA